MMRPTTPSHYYARQMGPSSPPETPTTSTFALGENLRPARRSGVYNFSRPLPIPRGGMYTAGKDPRFRYNPPMGLQDISPRSSTPSSDSESMSESECDSEASPSPPRSLSPEREPPELPQPKSPVRRCKIVNEGNFTIREMIDNDMEFDDDDALSVVHPDHYEDAESDAASTKPFPQQNDDTPKFVRDFGQLGLDEHDAWAQNQRNIRRMKRLNIGRMHKRKRNERMGSDSDDEDRQPFDPSEAGSNARRLRRKTEDGCLPFDDPRQRIPEQDEPDSSDDIDDMDAMQLETPTATTHVMGAAARQYIPNINSHNYEDDDDDDDDDDDNDDDDDDDDDDEDEDDDSDDENE